jgi:uncharacterized protein
LLSLRELQLRFTAALYEGGDTVVLEALDEARPSARGRLGIYRNNLRAGFERALALEYPVVAQLVGESFFRQTARDFQLQHPSRSGDIGRIGAEFPDYLRARFAVGDFAYLPDVAELEWALEVVAQAPERPGLTAADLAPLDPFRYEDLVFEPHPATRLVASAWSVVRLWQAHQHAEFESFDLAGGADRVLVRRRGAELEFVPLSPADFTFARMLARRTPLGLATDASLAVDRQFDLTRTLTSLVLAGAFAGVALPD